MLKEAHKEDLGPISDFNVDGTKKAKDSGSGKKTTKKREQYNIVKDLMLALNLCHNVTPVYANPDDPKDKSLQASSPDEVALVKFAETMGITLLKREEDYIQLQTILGDIEEFEILDNFPFSSETKRMGIIVREKRT